MGSTVERPYEPLHAVNPNAGICLSSELIGCVLYALA